MNKNSVIMLPTITPDTITIPPGSEVILRHQTWADYEQLLRNRQDRAALKIGFSSTTCEIKIMAPLPAHGKRAAALTNLIQVLLRHTGQDWDSYDPITLKQFRQKGVEPDHCFYIQNRQAVLGKDQIDLAFDPPPDLAVEMDLTCFTKASDYNEIGIPELWIYRQSRLLIYCFDGEKYYESDTSLLFPNIAVKELIPVYVEQSWTEGSSIALRAFETYLASHH